MLSFDFIRPVIGFDTGCLNGNEKVQDRRPSHQLKCVSAWFMLSAIVVSVYLFKTLKSHS